MLLVSYLLLVTCDGGETKSTPSLTDLDWTVRLDWSLTIKKFKKGHECISKNFFEAQKF